MKIASITEAKNRLSALIDRVRHGETVLITDRDRPVARLEPVTGENRAQPEAQLSHLERHGIVRRGSGKTPKIILEERPPKAGKGVSLLQTLMAERAESR